VRLAGRRRVGKSGSAGKSFDISKQLVWEAYRRVTANRGAPGVDEQSLAEFESDLKNNLYKIWNRLSSGTYFPPAVRAVEIPKPQGGVRVLGVPTVGDRIAQTVVAIRWSPGWSRSSTRTPTGTGRAGRRIRRWRLAGDGVGRRRGCWIWTSGPFFDSLDHELVVKAVTANISVEQRWVLLYVKRWLTAPLQHQDGTRQQRERGTPQGSAVSPVLANLVLHYAFDMFLVREFPGVAFERYADDGVPRTRLEVAM